ncbi:hypothetical protein O181_056320 [Austropuccinia psidii MF-1]|uniref:Uncharacterized protein n=1 Tax=Austropuccinia psidii MF-1 TaxID=1389203 RepID=A0A9Q3ECG7_9BASI|nr:hypothetical protein [Austropuccinia psidii MF-1]
MPAHLLRQSTLIKNVLQRPFRDSLSKKIISRSGTSHAGSQAFYGPEYETHEGFGNPLFLVTGAGIVALALYQTYSTSATSQHANNSSGTILAEEDEHKPWLTRYLAYHFVTDPQEGKKVEAHNLAVVFDAADKAYVKASIERPKIRRLANAGDFKIASPYGVFPTSETDFSDLRIKSYRDDKQKPDTNTHAKS